MPLSSFSPRVRDVVRAGVRRAHARPGAGLAGDRRAASTCCCRRPTGSGKTLAAFLWALDRLSAREPPTRGDAARGTRVVYVSPLKALAYDIERNLRAPLRGIGADGACASAIRTGDTPQRERAAMARKPPDILITTPESLYLILTSQAREMLARRRGGDRR